MLILQNVDGSNYFNRSWATFKEGFGSKRCNYWLGNELLHQLTKDGLYKLRFDLRSRSDGSWHWAEYSTFIVDSEATMYRLTIGGYTGNAGDAMNAVNTMKFTTFDSDNDNLPANCAINRGGGYWWKQCGPCRITGYGGLKGHMWKKLPETTRYLQTSRGWLMCP